MRTKINFKKSGDHSIIHYFFIIFLLVGSILAGIISVLYNLESKAYLSHLELEEKLALKVQVEMISNHFGTIISDLFYLSRQNELSAMLDYGQNENKELIAKEYLEFSRLKGIYDQIRFLDEKGMEIIRINYNNGKPFIVDDAKLQFKGSRYYFKDAILLGKGQVFVSPFDLNIENGIIEEPLKPMIRFGMPVFDRNKKKRGVILFNYLGTHMITLLKETAKLSFGNIMLLNSSGYWLCSPVPENEWGFMIKKRTHKIFPAFFPEVWEGISGSDKNQMYNRNGLFTSATIYPFQNSLISYSNHPDAIGEKNFLSAENNYYWKIISHIPRGKLDPGTQGILKKLFFLAVVSFVVSAIPSWFLAQTIIRRKMVQVELYQSANFDKLTDLPNRSLFIERFEQTLKQASRYERKFALLFIDLDGFKEVNDTMGHDGGDTLLIDVSQRLLGCIRGSDTVARFGGDEFTVLLSVIKSTNDVRIIAGKIIKELSKPFSIKGDKIQIGASVGISTYPVNGDNIERLMQKADTAMYQAKKEGKRDFRFAPQGIDGDGTFN